MKILCVTTGGTIASVRGDDGGLSPKEGKTFSLFFERQDRESFSDVSFDTENVFNLDSTNIGPAEWFKIADTIWNNVKEYDGFLITHGTDTLGYTGAALSMLLYKLGKPVVMTGSMIPFGEEGSDAEDNLLGAARELCCLTTSEVAVGTNPVYIYFAGKLMDARWTTKIDSSGKDAFLEIPHDEKDNDRILGLFLGTGKDADRNWYTVSWDKIRNRSRMPKVGLFKIYPGADPEILNAFLGYDGLLLECFGAGGVPSGASEAESRAATENASETGSRAATANASAAESREAAESEVVTGSETAAESEENKQSVLCFESVIKKLVASGVKVYAKTQCLYGGADLKRYSVGRKLLSAGALDMGLISTEMAIACLTIFLKGE